MKNFKKRFLNGKDALAGKHLKINTRKSNGKQVRRRTVQMQDRSIWSLWEESNGQFSHAQNVETGFMADVQK